MNLVNATPHPVTLVGEDGATVTLPPSGIAPRVGSTKTHAGTVEVAGVSVAIEAETPTALDGLPEPESGTYLIVSRVVAAAAPGRSDLLVPGVPVRDAAGNVIGCRTLSRLVPA